MKHTSKITFVLIGLFILAQIVGIFVVSHYAVNELPLGLTPPSSDTPTDFLTMLPSLIISFILAIALILLLTKVHAKSVMRAWFFLVVTIALTVSLYTIVNGFAYALTLTLVISLVLAYLKIFKRNIIVHNVSEVLIYPGVAAIFVPILNIWTLIVVLILISVYDMWAVWHSGIMQKMAKYQMNELKIFSGFFVPYLTQELREKLQKQKTAMLKSKKEVMIKTPVAILGGGDIVFPIIAAGVMLSSFGLVGAGLVVLGATIGLTALLLGAEKKKFYPAMPFISAGIFAGMLLAFLIA